LGLFGKINFKAKGLVRFVDDSIRTVLLGPRQGRFYETDEKARNQMIVKCGIKIMEGKCGQGQTQVGFNFLSEIPPDADQGGPRGQSDGCGRAALEGSTDPKSSISLSRNKGGQRKTRTEYYPFSDPKSSKPLSRENGQGKLQNYFLSEIPANADQGGPRSQSDGRGRTTLEGPTDSNTSKTSSGSRLTRSITLDYIVSLYNGKKNRHKRYPLDESPLFLNSKLIAALFKRYSILQNKSRHYHFISSSGSVWKLKLYDNENQGGSWEPPSPARNPKRKYHPGAPPCLTARVTLVCGLKYTAIKPTCQRMEKQYDHVLIY